MRKADPRYIRNVFHVNIGLLELYFGRLSNLLIGSEDEDMDLSHLSSSVFLSGFVAFESFVSDLFLAYMNRDFSVYQGQLWGRIESSITERFGQWAISRLRFLTLKHVPINSIEDIVDPEGKVITFSTTEKMVECAKNWLSPKHCAGLFALTPSDTQLLDTARAIRNYIAHESSGAYRLMNDKLATVDSGPPNDGLGRGKHYIQDVGVFLKAYAGSERRLTRYLGRLESISKGM